MIDNSLNLRALQHENNASKSDDYPSYTAVVTSEGTEGFFRSSNFMVLKVYIRSTDEIKLIIL